MKLFVNIQNTILELEEILRELENDLPKPQLVSYQDGFHYRHQIKHRSDVLASFLKMVRVTSLLNASVRLIEHGYFQESYILGRAIDEATEDITFWGISYDEIGTSSDQKKLLTDFYQEILTYGSDGPSITKWNAVTRSRIQEALGDIHDERESGKVKQVSRLIYRVFSSFSHGSYPSIMELYGRNFHVRGMLDTPREDECINNFSNYVYRAILALIVIASRMNRKDLLDRLGNIRIRFATETGCV